MKEYKQGNKRSGNKEIAGNKVNFFVRHSRGLITLSTITLLSMTAVAGGAYVIGQKYNPEAAMLKIANADQKIVKSYKILDANNQPLTNEQNIVRYDPTKIESKNKGNISELYLKTIVATEDNTFYTRKTNGYSIKGLLGAAASQIQTKIMHKDTVSRGGSTIDQQLAKIIAFGSNNANDVSDKVIQLIDARKISMKYSKNEVLQAYINELRLTSKTVGVKAASQDLFGNDLNNLDESKPENVAQIAYIAGLGQSPTTYVSQFNKYGKQRANVILGIMKENNLISNKLYKESVAYVKSDKFKIKSNTTSNIPKEYQSYVAEVNSEIEDMALPTNADIEVKTYADSNKLKQLYSIATSQYPSDDRIPRDYIEHSETLTALSAIDTKTGHIIGLATNSDNPLIAFQGNRSTGSTIKPLLDYAPAIEYAGMNGGTIQNGTTWTIGGWNVVNYGNQNFGPIKASKALGLSLNTAAVQAFTMTNDAQKNSIMNPLGMASYNPNGSTYNPVQAIDYPTNTLTLASAYSAIGNDGVRITPTSIASIKVNGKNIKTPEQERERAMSSSTAKTLVSMLQEVSNGSEPYVASQYTGLKAGTYAVKSGLSNYEDSVPGGTNKSPDALLALTSPEVSLAVWLGSPSYKDATYGITSAPYYQENSGRVYLLNSAISVMFSDRSKSTEFSYSNSKLTSKEVQQKQIPSAAKNETNYDFKNKFDPKNPTIDSGKQAQYDSNKVKEAEQETRLQQTYQGQ